MQLSFWQIEMLQQIRKDITSSKVNFVIDWEASRPNKSITLEIDIDGQIITFNFGSSPASHVRKKESMVMLHGSRKAKPRITFIDLKSRSKKQKATFAEFILPQRVFIKTKVSLREESQPLMSKQNQ